MLDFKLLVGRVRTTLLSSQRRAHPIVSGQPSTWSASHLSLRTREGWQALWRFAFPVLGFAAAYLAAYVYGNGLPSPAPLWPPDAILLSALLLSSPRRWWLYLLLTLPIRMLPAFAPGVPTWLLVVNWLNDTLKAVLAAVLVRRFAPRPLGFTTLRAMGVYLASAVLVAPILSAFVGAAGLVTLGTPYWQAWKTWFLGDVLASLVLAPTIVMWATASLRPRSRQRALEALLLGAALLFVGALLLFTEAALVLDNGLYYLPLPLLVWAAVRFGPRGIAGALTVVTCFAIARFAGLWGVVTSPATPRDVLSLQLFLIATAVPLLLLAAQIEERKQAVERVQRQAEELNRTFEAVADGIAVYDRDGRVLRTNAALERLLRLDVAPPEFVQLSLHERMALFAARDEQGRPLAMNEGPLPRALAGDLMAGEQAMMDLRSRAFDGRELELTVSAAPLRDSDGQLVGSVCVFRDQAERNHLAREREEARASALAERETARQMSTFLSLIGHELRNPLTSLKGQIQLAQRQLLRLEAAEDALPGTMTEMLQRLSTPAWQLERLISDLVEAAQLQRGQFTLAVRPCDLAHVIREVVEAQRAAWPERVLDLRVPEGEEVVVLADAERVGQVVINYLTNACKYSPPGSPITIILGVEAGQAHLAVRDQGPSIPLEEQSQIWEQFRRGRGVDARSGRKGGLGLGLYLCKELIERQGGQVGLESFPGDGSTFWFRLPRASSGGGNIS
jgi:signal transduction histidine kinase/integral membrane sensor domain MASE1